MLSEPPGTCLTDAELARLQAAVHDRLQGKVRDFRLFVRGDGLVLQGRVGCYYLKQLAQHSIMEATRTRILANEIEVPIEGEPDESLSVDEPQANHRFS